MSREILFRGKRIDNREWIEGYLLKLGKYSFSDPERFGIVEEAIPVGLDGIAFNMKIDEVYPGTVGQYTGLTDKNGKKIFEGDICLCETSGETCKYQVGWSDCNLEFELFNLSESFGIGYRAGYELEVICNIYGNPELLSA